MKILVSRINKGEIKINRKLAASAGKGLAVFIGIETSDAFSQVKATVEKIINLRLFPDKSGRLNYSIKDKGYCLLCIPNFSLCAQTKKGRRPSFEKAMEQKKAKEIFEQFIFLLKEKSIKSAPGKFGANMKINLELDGPLNIIFKTD